MERGRTERLTTPAWVMGALRGDGEQTQLRTLNADRRPDLPHALLNPQKTLRCIKVTERLEPPTLPAASVTLSEQIVARDEWIVGWVVSRSCVLVIVASRPKSGVKFSAFTRIWLKTAHVRAKFMQHSIRVAQSGLQPSSGFNL
jgi:hypothetical protein